MNNSRLSTLRLYQLADSTLPTGGFVFSSGLESMARFGWLRSSDDMYNYLLIQLEQACTAELPFINSITNSKTTDDLSAIFDYYNGFIQINEIRSASIRQAKSWIDILHEIQPDLSWKPSFLSTYSGTLHFTPVFALSLTNLELELTIIKDLYIYILLRDQISAAIRLGLTGPNKGSAILSFLLDKAPDYLKKYNKLNYKESFRANPMLEIAQAKHHTLYTKLFQN